MNLRLPIVVSVVAAAAGVAVFRGTHTVAPAALSVVDAAPSESPPLGRRVAVRERSPRIVVYVAGEVRHRGIYELAPTARAGDALRAAGGATASADLVAVNLAEPLSDGDEVAVPALGEDAAPAGTRSRSHGRHHGRHKKRRHHRHRLLPESETAQATGAESTADSGDREPTTVVRLNSADESELETLPGIGPALAERIVQFREQTGPYASTDDLLDVAGVTQTKLDAIAPYVSTGS
jgi:competence protein ComEA